MNFIQSLKESIGTFYYGLVSSYVRRHLLPVIEVLEGRVSGLYAHLESRGVPMPTDESGSPLPKDTEHLLPTLRHLDTRKVECYETEVPDGMGIGKLMFDANFRNSLTRFVDRGDTWTLGETFPQMLNVEEIEMNLLSAVRNQMSYTFFNSTNLPKLKRIYLPECVQVSLANGSEIFRALPLLEEIIMPKATSIFVYVNVHMIGNCPKLRKVVVGKLGNYSGTDSLLTGDNPNLLHIELAQEQSTTFSLQSWSPTLDSSNLAEFQSNFHEYIAKRLATFPESGSHPTLTLSQTVRDAITQQSEDLIVATKHWSLAPARTPSV